jgi:hypothetical protein
MAVEAYRIAAMNTKAKLRESVLRVIFKPNSNHPYDVFQLTHLFSHVALDLKGGDTQKLKLGLEAAPDLDEDDKMLVREIFWDLFIEKVITIGKDALNERMPFYRLHTDAVVNAKRGI